MIQEVSDSDLEKIKRIAKSGSGGRTMASGVFTGDEAYIDKDSLISARRLFISRLERSLFSVDVSQMEISVFLYYIGEAELLERISRGGFDFHKFVAIDAFGANEADSNFKFIREIAKSITFGIIYGMGLETLAIQIGKSKEEAREFREKYFNLMPKAKIFMEKTIKKVKNRETIYNDYGRRYILPEEDAYKLINYLTQGTAGEIIKENMIEIDKFLIDKKTRMLLQIHDELIFEVPEDEEHLLKKIAKIMQKNSLGIHMNLDIKKCGSNWAGKEDYVL